MMHDITAWLGKGNRRTARTALVSMIVLMLLLADVRLLAQTFTVLHTFNGGDGNYPIAGLIRDSAGNLYGTTGAGGNLGLGTVFKLSKAGFRVLHRFAGSPSDGAYPYGPLVQDAAGDFYGTTSRGGRRTEVLCLSWTPAAKRQCFTTSLPTHPMVCCRPQG